MANVGRELCVKSGPLRTLIPTRIPSIMDSEARMMMCEKRGFIAHISRGMALLLLSHALLASDGAASDRSVH